MILCNNILSEVGIDRLACYVANTVSATLEILLKLVGIIYGLVIETKPRVNMSFTRNYAPKLVSNIIRKTKND